MSQSTTSRKRFSVATSTSDWITVFETDVPELAIREYERRTTPVKRSFVAIFDDNCDGQPLTPEDLYELGIVPWPIDDAISAFIELEQDPDLGLHCSYSQQQHYGDEILGFTQRGDGVPTLFVRVSPDGSITAEEPTPELLRVAAEWADENAYYEANAYLFETETR